MNFNYNNTGNEAYAKFSELLSDKFKKYAKRGINMSSGNPSFEPFMPAIEAAQRALFDTRSMKQYHSSEGIGYIRRSVLNFCKENHIADKSSPIDEGNIITGIGVTHLYSVMIEILANKAKKEHPNKTPVLLMTAPTYGIFALQPEALGFRVETIPLREEDAWRTNPEILQNRIKEINNSDDYYVSAFYRINPSNPMGSVEGHDLTKSIANILKTNNVFGIDDLAYLGQENTGTVYSLTNFDADNNVSMLSLSKTFCMPDLRAGFMYGSKEIINKASDIIMRTLQAVPTVSANALIASFGDDFKSERAEYIQRNIKGYQHKYKILEAMIYGLEAIDSETAEVLEPAIISTFGDRHLSANVIKNGIENVDIINRNPESGYFAVLRFNDVGKSYYDNNLIESSFNVASACLNEGKTLILPMSSALSENSLYNSARVTFGLSDEKIIKGCKGIYQALRNFTNKPIF